MRSFDTPEPISVAVEIGVGDIRIAASDRSDTLVEVRPSDPAKKADVTAAEQTRIEYSDGRLLIKTPRARRQFRPWGGGESIDVEIDLPTGSNLRGEAAVATLRSSGRLGECRYKTSVGDVHIEQAGPLELRTVAGDVTVDRATEGGEVTAGSGAVRVGRIDGRAVIKNSNGDTWIGEMNGDIRVNAANGRIVVEQAQANVTAKTANGDIRIGGLTHGGTVAETAYGSVEIGIRAGVPAWLDLATKYGTVRNDLDAADRPKAGEDAVEVRAHTAFGDINVGRSYAPDMEGPKP